MGLLTHRVFFISSLQNARLETWDDKETREKTLNHYNFGPSDILVINVAVFYFKDLGRFRVSCLNGRLVKHNLTLFRCVVDGYGGNDLVVG